ncbi:hypothetical protein TetV_585 [Tetraselmis virus 1]|uniref:Uncharacterized protein n=1 Tax=Tetraselmis virus 1 TaxID=2060617 RepID=A0A2P0VP33_9VIRU|nr:hypothetical protein QJ968_gp469 [Tetraselmis virus 1]AUF82667.1 hypothetical protein TetV_585 [Tetraselmis virus 1]
MKEPTTTEISVEAMEMLIDRISSLEQNHRDSSDRITELEKEVIVLTAIHDSDRINAARQIVESGDTDEFNYYSPEDPRSWFDHASVRKVIDHMKVGDHETIFLKDALNRNFSIPYPSSTYKKANISGDIKCRDHLYLLQQVIYRMMQNSHIELHNYENPKHRDFLIAWNRKEQGVFLEFVKYEDGMVRCQAMLSRFDMLE